jgi:hypothetical protein
MKPGGKSMRQKLNKHNIAALLVATIVTQISLPANAAQRYLKMRAHVGNIAAKPVTLPSGEVVDFPYVANALFYSQVFTHGYFEESNHLEHVLEEVKSDTGTVNNSEFSTKAFSEDARTNSDAALLQKYFGDSRSSSGGAGLMKTASVDGGNTNGPENTPICQYNQPAVKLNGAVIAYELAFGGGITVGYNGKENHPIKGANGSFNLKSSRLDMQFEAIDPLFSRPGAPARIATAPVQKNVIDLDLSVGLDIGFPIGINFFMRGSIPNAIRKAITGGLTAVIKEYQKQRGDWSKIWESRVIYSKLADYDDFIAIAGGERSYIHVGDQFRIKNMYWSWAGKPCESHLRADTMASAKFGEAVGTVIEVGPYVSILRVVPVNGNERAIMPGALVKIEKLK